MTNLFTIKAVEVETDASGIFNINPANDGGYNIIATPYVNHDGGEYATVLSLPGTAATVNVVFEHLLITGVSLSEIQRSVDSRLFGLNKFKAVNGANPIQNNKVRVFVVLWH